MYEHCLLRVQSTWSLYILAIRTRVPSRLEFQSSHISGTFHALQYMDSPNRKAARITPRPPQTQRYRDCALKRAIGKSVLESHPAAEMEELCQVHASLSARVMHLEAELRLSYQQFAAFRFAESQDTSSRDRILLQRTIMFAKMYAEQAVKAPNPELSKVYPVLCERRSVRQTVLLSSAIDCTLLEFRILGFALARNSSNTV